MVDFGILNLHDGGNFVTSIVALRAKILDLGNVYASIAAALSLRILCKKLRSEKVFCLLNRNPEKYSGHGFYPLSDP